MHPTTKIIIEQLRVRPHEKSFFRSLNLQKYGAKSISTLHDLLSGFEIVTYKNMLQKI